MISVHFSLYPATLLQGLHVEFPMSLTTNHSEGGPARGVGAWENSGWEGYGRQKKDMAGSRIPKVEKFTTFCNI